MKAITLKPHWAWAILHAKKDVENRIWRTSFRGRILIHSAKSVTDKEFGDAAAFIFDRFNIQVPEPDTLPRGAIVGAVNIVDCVEGSTSEWFTGPYGFVLREPKALARPVRCRGNQGIFVVPNDVAASVREAAAA